MDTVENMDIGMATAPVVSRGAGGANGVHTHLEVRPVTAARNVWGGVIHCYMYSNTRCTCLIGSVCRIQESTVFAV